MPSFYEYPVLKQIYIILKNSDNLNETEKLFLFLMINHGLTNKDILSISFSNIIWSEKEIVINRNGIERYIFLDVDDLFFLSRYLFSKKFRINLYASPMLFQTDGIPMTAYDIQKALKKVSTLVNRKIQQRTLRNTFIIYAIDSGINIEYIQAYLGLRSLSSLQRFKYINQKYFGEVIELQNSLRSKIELTSLNKSKNNACKVVQLFKQEVDDSSLPFYKTNS